MPRCFPTAWFFMADGARFEARMTVAQAQAALGEGFMRCHRSYIGESVPRAADSQKPICCWTMAARFRSRVGPGRR